MKPHRIRIKAGEFVLNVELTRELGARTNKQIREDSERFWESFDRWMKSPGPEIKVLWDDYDRGGPLRPGLTVAYNDTDEPEQVL